MFYSGTTPHYSVLLQYYSVLQRTSSTARGGSDETFEDRNLKTYRRDWLLCVKDGRAKTLMDRQVIEISLFLSLPSSFSGYLPTYLPIYLPT